MYCHPQQAFRWPASRRVRPGYSRPGCSSKATPSPVYCPPVYGVSGATVSCSLEALGYATMSLLGRLLLQPGWRATSVSVSGLASSKEAAVLGGCSSIFDSNSCSESVPQSSTVVQQAQKAAYRPGGSQGSPGSFQAQGCLLLNGFLVNSELLLSRDPRHLLHACMLSPSAGSVLPAVNDKPLHSGVEGLCCVSPTGKKAILSSIS